MQARAVIAEDEPVQRAGLVRLLSTAWPELEIAGSAEDGLAAIRLLEQHRPDVVFLDIQLPGASGLDVARVASTRCHVVFVTAYDEYAVAAFERGAVDYVMKPFDAVRLKLACHRVKERLSTRPADLEALLQTLQRVSAAARRYLRWINVGEGTRVRLVTVDEVCYFQADLRYTRLVTAQREALVRMSLKELSSELDPETFWQIHRSTIVNVNAIDDVRRDRRGRMVLHLKQREESLVVSQPYTHRFKQM